MDPEKYLQSALDRSIDLVGNNQKISSELSKPATDFLDIIIELSESGKGVLAVVITSIVFKKLNPNQDIRNHQDSIPNGYSGRTFDTKHITPFLKKCRFPAMASSGWLTRSLEQKQPYGLDYPGAITPKKLKDAFLHIVDQVEKGANCDQYLEYLFQGLIIQRNKQSISLARPTNLTIETILYVLDKHFNSKHKAKGASRLPVLAFYAVYQCLTNEAKRFENKTLLPIESHTSADARSGRIGDIDIIDENGRAFEALEIKYGIPISLNLIEDAYSKFQTTPVDRYYILTTAKPPGESE